MRAGVPGNVVDQLAVVAPADLVLARLPRAGGELLVELAAIGPTIGMRLQMTTSSGRRRSRGATVVLTLEELHQIDAAVRVLVRRIQRRADG